MAHKGIVALADRTESGAHYRALEPAVDSAEEAKVPGPGAAVFATAAGELLQTHPAVAVKLLGRSKPPRGIEIGEDRRGPNRSYSRQLLPEVNHLVPTAQAPNLPTRCGHWLQNRIQTRPEDR